MTNLSQSHLEDHNQGILKNKLISSKKYLYKIPLLTDNFLLIIIDMKKKASF